jgi:hypothetical protein
VLEDHNVFNQQVINQKMYNKSYPKAGQGNKQARGEKYESMVYRQMFTLIWRTKKAASS